MSVQVIELSSQDDVASIRHRLGLSEAKRVVLVIPWDMHFLSRRLDFDLLRREAERWQLEIAIVCADPVRRDVAHQCGFPVFANVDVARETRKWRARSPGRVEPPARHWWDEDVDLQPRPARPRARWLGWTGLGIRIVIFLLSLAIIAGSAYVIVPSGAVTLVPAGQVFDTIVPVSVDPEAEAVDHATRVIPARRVGDEFEGYAEVETTGVMNLVVGRAIGDVVFTNLLAQDYVVPSGTIVRTSSTSYPIRFRTTADVAVPAGGQATAPIEALEDGIGNVGAFQINQVEGVAASAVRVINPRQTTGAEPREARVVIQVDRDRVRERLMQQLLDQAYLELSTNYLEPTEILLRESMRIEAVPKEVYNRFITEQADTVGLNLRLLVSGWAVDLDNAEAVAYVALSQCIPAGYELLDAQYVLGEVAEEDVGPGLYTFFVTAQGYADATLNTDAAVSLVRGQRLADAQALLTAEFPLAQEPQIILWPEWPSQLERLERMPLVPLRIDVRVVPQGS